jgi:branched-chain amino acid transport system permease protein
MGTLYGAVLGTALFMVAQAYLQDLLRVLAQATDAAPLLAALLSPDRWLLWMGLLFVCSVYFFPNGIVGELRRIARQPITLRSR